MAHILVVEDVTVINDLICKNLRLVGHSCTSLSINLLDNAINASYEESEIKLTSNTKNEEVIITLEDFGKRIEEERLLHITEPFYCGDKARNRSEGGTGLGLSVCAEIVKRHHAKMEFCSIVGDGTMVILTFTTSLPPYLDGFRCNKCCFCTIFVLTLA